MRPGPNWIAVIAACGSLALTSAMAGLAQPAQGIGPLVLPSLTQLPLPSLPLPSLTPPPLPTLPLPSLRPSPLPSIGLPTPLPSLPSATSNGSPRPSAEPSTPTGNADDASPSPGPSLTRPDRFDQDGPDGGAAPPASAEPSTEQAASSQAGSVPRTEWLIPLLAMAVPAFLIAALIALQVVGGGFGIEAARRLLDRVAARAPVPIRPLEPGEADLMRREADPRRKV
jgi:hypothetical protein